MKEFSKLFQEIDATTSTNEKVDALVRYFAAAPPEDAIYCIALLTGRRPKRTVRSGELRSWSAEMTGIPLWLQEESYHIVGDLAETISLLQEEKDSVSDIPLHQLMEQLAALSDKDEATRKAFVTGTWNRMNRAEIFLFTKLITGSFRVGVSEKIVIKALAKHFAMDENTVAHRLSGGWIPQDHTAVSLLQNEDLSSDISKPYPFYLAYALESAPEALGAINDWIIERKYDGIRAQIIRRADELFIWSRGEDLLTEKFPEFNGLKEILPSGTVLDGEILPVKDGQILPFHVMQTRIGRKNLSKKSLEDAPLAMICYDLLEYNGEDIRHLSMQERRTILAQLIEDLQREHPQVPLSISPIVPCASWEDAAVQRLDSRALMSEGLMLKLKSGSYKTGRKRGEWWKWKIDPLSVDGVLIYAQRGHGRRADLYTDFTFAVWDGDTPVPFCKAYSGLTDKELLEVDQWIKRNTLDKFGPVRSVQPKLVFEIGFEGINPSPRHKSGVALRFPRILRWRHDKAPAEANTKEELIALMNAYGTKNK